MIYPSHWTSYFGITKPDLEPYKLVSAYAKLEKEKLGELKTPPTSEVQAQIYTLNKNGINEYLLWNAANNYTQGVDYKP